MGGTAFLFPGQGAQAAGMGADLARAYREAREVFEAADAALGFPLSTLCFEGPAERLQETPITQPALLTASVAVLRVLERYGVRAGAAAGLSLGEYTALVAAGALDFADAVVLVHRRGRFMEEAVPAGQGAMAAVIGLPRDRVEAVCREAAAAAPAPPGGGPAVVEAVNYNCPGQIVIAGHAGAVALAGELAREAGAKRVLPLAVSGPFHSRLMAPAAARLAEEIERVPVADARFPVVSNVTAGYVTAAEEIRRLLVKQVASPVYWEDGMRRLLADGFDRFIEVGPGSVLAGFLKRIDREARVEGVQDLSGLERLLELRGEVC